MEKIFSGEVCELLPLSNGLIFSYCRDRVDDRQADISYKMISFEDGRLTDVAKNMYLLTKFGNNYKAVLDYCDNFITDKALVLAGGKVFLMRTSGAAYFLDNDGTPLWTGSLAYRSSAPDDIVLYNNSLWASYSDCNVLLRYNLTTMREELRIGGNKSPFDKPGEMFIQGDSVVVSNRGSGKLLQVDLNSYSVTEKETFDETVYQYLAVSDYRFVILKSGLYVI